MTAARNHWHAQLQAALSCYQSALLHKVGDRLLRSRARRSDEELIEKIIEAMDNAVLIDRRLRTLPEPARRLLALVGLGQQITCSLTTLLELLSLLQPGDGMPLVLSLLEQGFLYPSPGERDGKFDGFERWLSRCGAPGLLVFVPPLIAQRALSLGLPLSPLAHTTEQVREVRESDGLELFLRLAALWQSVRTVPLRLTRQGEFYKRDHERLSSEPLLAGETGAAELPDLGQMLVDLGQQLGLLKLNEMQIEAAAWPDGLASPTDAALVVWSALQRITFWNPAKGWQGFAAHRSPYGSALVGAAALLAALPEKAWIRPGAIAVWLARQHLYWRGRDQDDLTTWADRTLLGLAALLRVVQTASDEEGKAVVRLSPMGRHVLGLGPPPAIASFPKTLFVQPNLEIVAYRQGLTPGLIADLSTFADWKTLGPACTLQLCPESVYRGLELGRSFERIMQLLQQHGVRELPDSVVQSLRTWANKRERLTVYSAATLLEFNDQADLQAALGRGLPAVPIAACLAIVPHETDIDYKHFRLVAARDYSRPTDLCVMVQSDGVTLAVDVARSDLLLETEIQRFADSVPAGEGESKRLYRLTPASLARCRERGVTVAALEEWFLQRTGQELSPAARLLCTTVSCPLTVAARLVLETPSTAIADGLAQWPATAALLGPRLGDQTFVVTEANLPKLRAVLAELGVACECVEPTEGPPAPCPRP